MPTRLNWGPTQGRRSFSGHYKLEPVRLVRERGVAVAQATRDQDVHENVLRRWVKELAADPLADPLHDFPGQKQMKPEQAEIGPMRREVQKLMASATS